MDTSQPTRAVARRERANESIKAQRRAEAQRKAATLLTVAAGAFAMIGAALYPILIDASRNGDRTLAMIGAPAAEAGCMPPTYRNADGTNDHRPVGETVDYEFSPPAFGPHWPVPQDMGQKFYTTKDRPDVEILVHNLEHGFTILWYDESLSDKDLSDLKAIARQFPNTTGVDDKFIVAPWTKADGADLRGGAKMALTHWSVTEDLEQQGVWEFCDQISGEVVENFVADYPFDDAPEGNLPGDM